MPTDDVYWINVMPAMDKVLPAMRKALPGLMKNAGSSAGGDFSASFTQTAVSAVEKASAQLAAARKKDTAASAAAEAAARKEADAAGRVAVARQRLAELVEKGTASTSQLAAANEKLASAQRGQEGAASALVRAQQAQQDTADQVTRSTRLLSEQQTKAETSGDQMARSLRDGDKAADTASRGMDKVRGSLGTMLGALGAGATIVSGFWDAVGAEKGTDRLAAQLGLDPAEAQRAGAIAGGLYRDAYGDSLQQVDDAVGAVMSSLDGMRTASDADLRAATANALNFAAAFNVDVNDAVSSAGILMRTGLAKDATEAFDLMTAGLQQVPAALRPSVLEATDEYGQFFASLGYSGRETMALIVDAAAKGQFGIDKFGDAMKELGIRATDLADPAAQQALAGLGLAGTDVANALLSGGAAARAATDQIVAGLQGITDPGEQAAAAVALLGTPLEDMNKADIPEFLDALSGANGELENVAGTAAAMGDTLGNNTATRIEEMNRSAMGAVQDGLVALADGFTSGQTTATGWQGTLQTVGATVKDVFTFVRDTAVPALKDAGTWIQNNSTWLVPLAGTLGGAYLSFKLITGAIEGWKTAQSLLNGVMNASPLMKVVTLVSLVVGALVTAYQTSDTFRGIVDGVFRAVGSAASWMWDTVLKPVFGWLGEAWTAVSTAIGWAWDTLIKPAWNAIATTASWLWNDVLSPVFGWIGSGFDALGRAFGWVWDTFLSPVFSWFGDALGTIKDGFTTAVDWIGRTWEGLKDTLMTPVQWVIDFVWNDGLRKLWNTINNLWDGDDLPTFQLASGGVIGTGAGTSGSGGTTTRLATGGVLPGYTPGRDVHIFTSPTGGRLELSGGEAVMRPEWTRVLGRPTIDYWNALARTQGEAGLRRVLSTPRTADAGRGDPPSPQAFASGGVISLPGWLDTVLDFVPGGGTVTSVIDALNSGTGFGDGAWGSALLGTAKKAGTELWDAASSLFDGGGSFGASRPIGDGGGNGGGFGAALSWARSQVGKPYIWGGIGPTGYDCSGFMSAITNVIRGRSPYARVGATSSFPWAGFAPGTGPFTIGSSKNTGSGIGHMAGTLLGVNVESRGSDGVVVGPRARGAMDSLFTTRAALFDDGGLWSNGLGLNQTGGVERVLTPEQDDYFRRFVDVAGNTTGQAAAYHQVRVFIGDRDITDIVRTEVEDIDGERADEMRAELAAAGLI